MRQWLPRQLGLHRERLSSEDRDHGDESNSKYRRRIVQRYLRGILIVASCFLAVHVLLSLLEVKLKVFGCTGIGKHCVVAAKSGASDTTAILLNLVPRHRMSWCRELRGDQQRCEAEMAWGYRTTVNGTLEEFKIRKRCAEWIYTCAKTASPERRNVTLWYHHFHKAGGSTFVRLAQANGVTLMPRNQNGNPLNRQGERVAFWNYDPRGQAAWRDRIRDKYSCDMVVTEFGFPASTNFLAPLPFIYVTVLREPVSRMVSNFFWRYRRFFAGEPEPRLPKGAKPQFRDMAERQRNFYVNTLARDGGDDEGRLKMAKHRLSLFTVVLICEWLDKSAELLQRQLGWPITDFEAFHEKENSGLKDYSYLTDWHPEWRIQLQDQNDLDVDLYGHAQLLARKQLKRFGLESAAPPLPDPVRDFDLAPPASATAT